ncbi:DUF2087 domain-containing protein [Paenibacillus sp. GCM10023250]|uniref:DUF2087 domain-containing protein n=1 Tax=Paenibacillus sp. GCM10023250 TaxID=3252648 RepID=UPI0036137811
MDVSEALYEASLPELKRGYMFHGESDSYCCLVCGQRYEEGIVYPAGDRMMEARKAIAAHVAAAHGSMLQFLLGLDKKSTGLTELQKLLIGAFASGKPDAEIVGLAGAGSASTIRNHRFALKERAKQAKLFLAIMELLDESAGPGAKAVPARRTAPLPDERFALPPEEYKALLDKYLPQGLDGPLTGLPRKAKRRTALLRHIATSFRKGRRYREAEVDELLARLMPEEFATLRLLLVDYGFLVREGDSDAYRLGV